MKSPNPQTQTPTAGDAPASYGVDLAAEAALVASYDVPRLGRRLVRALERRRFAHGAMSGALATLAVVGLGAVAARSMGPAPAPAPSCPVCPLEEEALWAPSCPGGLEGNDDTDDPEPRVGATPPSPRAVSARAAAPTAPASSSAAPPPPVAAPPSPAVEPTGEGDSARAPSSALPAAAGDEGAPAEETSRLRHELALFDVATRALAGGDDAAALEAARALRARYPRGPLAVEAGIVVVKALRDQGRRGEARAALEDLRRDPRAGQKAADIALLARSLAVEEPMRRVLGGAHSGGDSAGDDR